MKADKKSRGSVRYAAAAPLHSCVSATVSLSTGNPQSKNHMNTTTYDCLMERLCWDFLNMPFGKGLEAKKDEN